jgi:hypothetical protein
MTRLIVPRGNGFDSPLPVCPIDSTSPRWGLLNTDEKRIAAQEVDGRQIMRVVMAARVMAECLGDARRAKSGAEWEERRERLRRVKAAVFGRMFGGLDDEGIRRAGVPVLRARMILLKATRPHATTAAAQAMNHLLRWRDAGEVPPPRFGRHYPNWPAEMKFGPFNYDETGLRRASQVVWDREHILMVAAKDLAVRQFLDEELRAFPGDPPPDEFYDAAGGRIIPERLPKESAIQLASPEEALKHVVGMVDMAQSIVTIARRAAGMNDAHALAEVGEVVCRHAKRLSDALMGYSINASLLLAYCDKPVEFPPVIERTVHEAAWELCRRVQCSARGRFRLDEPNKFYVDTDGPWEGSEAGKGLAAFVNDCPELCTAFDDRNAQRLVAELRLEASREVKLRGTLQPAPASKGEVAQKSNNGGRKARSRDFDKLVTEAAAADITLTRLAKEHDKTVVEVAAAIKRYKQALREKAATAGRK